MKTREIHYISVLNYPSNKKKEAMGFGCLDIFSFSFGSGDLLIRILLFDS